MLSSRLSNLKKDIGVNRRIDIKEHVWIICSTLRKLYNKDCYPGMALLSLIVAMSSTLDWLLSVSCLKLTSVCL